MEASRRYNPKIDLVFRKLFGSEENKDLLTLLAQRGTGLSTAD